MDWPIKQTLLQNGIRSKRSYCGVNSYNIGRPLVQMIHWVSTSILGVLSVIRLIEMGSDETNLNLKIWTYLRVAEQLGISPGDQGIASNVVLISTFSNFSCNTLTSFLIIYKKTKLTWRCQLVQWVT